MTGDDKHIDHLFRDGLKGHRPKAPVQSWQRLDEALDGVIRRRKMFYFRLAAASVLIVLAFGAGFFYATVLNKPATIAEQEVVDESNIPSSQFDNTVSEFPTKEIISTDSPDFESSATSNPDVSDDKVRINPNSLPSIPTEDITSASRREVPGAYPKQEIITGNNKPGSLLTTLAFIDATKVDPEEGISSPKMIARSEHKETQYGYNGFLPMEDYGIESKSNEKQWAVGAQFAPTQSYRDISVNYNPNTSINQGLEDNLNEAEDALLSYSGGVNVDYNFSGKWAVQSGVYFSRIGQVNNDALQFKQDNKEFLLFAITTSTGGIDIAFERVPDDIKRPGAVKDTIDMGGISNVKVVQNFDLFEIPLVLKYKFFNKRFSMNLSGGLSPAYLLGNNTFLETEDRKYDVGSAGNLNSMIVNTSLGMGFEYLFTRTLSMSFEPTFKYSLNPINNNSDFSYHPYYFSWFTGIRLKIN